MAKQLKEEVPIRKFGQETGSEPEVEDTATNLEISRTQTGARRESDQKTEVIGRTEMEEVVREAVKEKAPTSNNVEQATLSSREIADILYNVELKVGKKVDGMEPAELLESILNLPRNNN